MMCNGEFRDKSPEDALDYLDYIVENAQHWDTIGSYESSSKPQSSPSGGGMHNLREDHDFQAKFTPLARKVKALELKKNDNVKFVQNISCYVYDSIDHSVLVAIDYVSKWIEAIPCWNNNYKVVIRFLKENLLSRFGIPRAIISDEGKHFCNKPFESLIKKYGITHKVATPHHPQTSRQGELTNREIK